MKLLENALHHRQRLAILLAVMALYGCTSSPTQPQPLEPAAEPAVEPVAEPAKDLLGEWCKVKKRRVTKYTVEEGTLHIRSGRSGQYYEAALNCNDGFTECEAKTIRGWNSPVTEILRLDGSNMNLTRIWGGAWNDKTYNFTFTRCPKW